MNAGGGSNAVVAEETSDDYFHCFMSHCWGRLDAVHKKVIEITRLFRNQDLKVWIDDDHMGCRIDGSIMKGIEDSCCFVLCLSREYARKADDLNKVIAQEINVAQDDLERVVIFLLEKELKDPAKWAGRKKLLFRNHKYFDLSGDLEESNDAVNAAVSAIKSIQRRFGKRKPTTWDNEI